MPLEIQVATEVVEADSEVVAEADSEVVAVEDSLLEEEVAFEAEVDDSLVEVEVEVITIRTISPVL